MKISNIAAASAINVTPANCPADVMLDADRIVANQKGKPFWTAYTPKEKETARRNY